MRSLVRWANLEGLSTPHRHASCRPTNEVDQTRGASYRAVAENDNQIDRTSDMVASRLDADGHLSEMLIVEGCSFYSN